MTKFQNIFASSVGLFTPHRFSMGHFIFG